MALRADRVARVLAEVRQRHGLTQEQAAAQVSVTMRSWQRWEAGEAMPFPRNLDLIASHFDFSVSEFFDDDPAPELTQLDRIEAKLDALLDHFELSDPGEELEALLEDAVDQQAAGRDDDSEADGRDRAA